MRKRSTVILLGILLLVVASFALAVQRSRRQFWLNRHLCSAVKSGEIDRVRELLAQGADPNTREVLPPPPAGFFARLVAMVRPSRVDSSSMTPLHRAVIEGDETLVEALIRAGADVDAPFERIGNPLYIAANASNDRMIQRLLGHGANPNKRSAYGSGYTLEVTAQKCNVAAFEALLAHGAVMQPSPGIRRLLTAAARNEDPAILELLLDRGYLPASHLEKNSLLLDAIAFGNAETVKLLADRGADVNGPFEPTHPYYDGTSLLEMAKTYRSAILRGDEYIARADMTIRMLKAQGAK